MVRGSVITYHRLGDSLVIKSHQSLFHGDSGKFIAHIEMSRIVDADRILTQRADFRLTQDRLLFLGTATVDKCTNNWFLKFTFSIFCNVTK